MNNYFKIKDLKVSFKTTEEVKNVLNINKLNLYKGETLGIVGESGAGKSVLAMSILRILPSPPALIESGEIIFKGQNLLSLEEKEMQRIRGREISMIFQDSMSALNPVFTVGQQIMNVILRHNKHFSKKEAKKEALKMIELVKLPDAKNTLNKYPNELSGGQRQRIIIGIALSCDAELLIADEPTRNLDVTIQAGILKLIDELIKELGISVLFIANNINLVFIVSDRVAILYKGKIIEVGTSQDLKKEPFHPYTQILLGKISPTDYNLKEEIKINNAICPYFDKCEKRIEICEKISPILTKANNTHWISCHRVIDKEVNNE